MHVVHDSGRGGGKGTSVGRFSALVVLLNVELGWVGILLAWLASVFCIAVCFRG